MNILTNSYVRLVRSWGLKHIYRKNTGVCVCIYGKCDLCNDTLADTSFVEVLELKISLLCAILFSALNCLRLLVCIEPYYVHRLSTGQLIEFLAHCVCCHAEKFLVLFIPFVASLYNHYDVAILRLYTADDGCSKLWANR